MPQSLSKILVHLVFSTKDRLPCLPPKIREALYPYMATILKNMDCPAIKIGGIADHVHVLCVLSKNLSVAKLIEEVKKPTSKWLKSKGAACGKFQWQNGYGAFSVSQSSVPRVRKYIEDQEKHHQGLTFQEEVRGFLDRYHVPYDERYVWG